MKKMLFILSLALILGGFTGCKEETPAEKIEDGATGLEEEAKEKQDLLEKKTNDFLEKSRVEIEEKEVPKDHPAH